MRQWRDLALWSGTLLFTALGQFYFLRRPAFFWDGVVFYLVGIGLFLVLLRRSQERGPAHGHRLIGSSSWLQQNWPRGLLACLGFGSDILALRVIHSQPSSYWGAMALWLAGMLLYVGAFWPSLETWWGIPVRVWRITRARKGELALVAILTVIALAFRMVNLEGAPQTLSGDEGSMGLEALSVLSGESRNMFVTGWLSHPTMYFFLLAAMMKLLGTGAFGLRALSALVGAATIPLFYLALSRPFGKKLALAGATYLCFYHFHIHFSRIAINNIEDPFFFLLVLYLLDDGLESGRTMPFALAGLALGLAQYFYTGTRLIPLVALAYLAVLAWRDREFLERHRWKILAFFGGAVVAALPLALFFWEHPGDFNARTNLVGIIQSGWLRREVQITGKSSTELLAQQFIRALLAFNLFPDRTAWYGLRGPLLDSLSGIFFLLGLAYSLYHWRERRYLLLILWFALGIVIGGMFTVSPPSSMRLVNLAPVVAFLVVLGLRAVAKLGESILRWPPLVTGAIVAGTVIGLGLGSIQLYFWHYLPTLAYGSFNAEVATAMGQYLAHLGKGYRCYFFGPPRMYYGFATIPFLAQGVEGTDIDGPFKGEVVAPDKDAVFVFLPEREEELGEIEARYPGGNLLRLLRGKEGPELFTSYEVERTKLEPR